MTSEQKEAFLNSWFGSMPENSGHWSNGMSGNLVDEYSERFDEAIQAYTRAVPDVPELVRYKPDYTYSPDWDIMSIMQKDEKGEYVLHSQAAEIIAAKDAERNKDITAWRDVFDSMHRRAMEAEAKNIELEAAWLNAEGKISDLEHKLAQIEKPIGYVSKSFFESLKIDRFHSIAAYVLKERSERYSEPLYAAPVASDADLREENERLREALKPLIYQAKERNAEGLEWLNSDTVRISVTIGDLRAALKPSEPDKK